jgi:hypothetical protein
MPSLERAMTTVVGVNRRLAPQWRARGLAAPIGDQFVYIHVELRALSVSLRMSVIFSPSVG